MHVNPLLMMRPATGERPMFVLVVPDQDNDLLVADPQVARLVARLSILDDFDGDRLRAEVRACLRDDSPAEELGQQLVEHHVVVDGSRQQNPVALAAERWNRYGWATAFRYHWSTRDYPFLRYDEGGYAEDRDRMRAFLESSDPPSLTKHYEGLPQHLLPSEPERTFPRTADELSMLFSLTSAADRVCSLEDLSFVLGAAGRATGLKHWPPQGDFLLKRVPSGGSRHPTEIYLCATGIDELSKSWYYYDPLAHGLTELHSGAVPVFPNLERRIDFVPRAVLVFTSVVERSMWRYRDSRSYRAITMDIGHVLNTVRLAAIACRLPFWTGHEIDHLAFADLSRTDSVLEPAIHGVVIG